jgi:outer membrane lipoprotein-sorting protein
LSPEALGLEIAREADRRDTGFGDFTATLSMVLRNRHGEESTRQMRMKTLEVKDDGDKMLVVFDEPRDVSGTALLSFAHRTGSDDQWFYLPALRRVKRIASNNKAGPFMGSEFAYEDFSSQEVEKYTYRFLDEELLDGTLTWRLERYPVDPASGYTRQMVWFDQEEYRVLKVDYYDRRNELLKTLTIHGYQQFAGRFWRSERMEMVNHQTGKSTTLVLGDYAFGTGLTDRDFDRNSLTRVR